MQNDSPEPVNRLKITHNMRKVTLLILTCLFPAALSAQKLETVYLDKKDSTSNMYIAVIPEAKPVKALMFLLDGFGAAPEGVWQQTELPGYAAQQGILTIIPLLKTGPLYFGSDAASQQSLKEQVSEVVSRYKVHGKDLFIGGFSIGGACAVKYAELAVKENYPVKPKAVFAVDAPLDWERFYNSAKRVVRLSDPARVNPEVTYMIGRIEKEMKGTPQTALENFYNNSPYSYSDSTQRAVKKLVNTPLMLITEPDIQWWLSQRGYDYSYINVTDHAAMINELQRLGNKNAVLVTTADKGFRKPDNKRHPHSWSIADPEQVVKWLMSH